MINDADFRIDPDLTSECCCQVLTGLGLEVEIGFHFLRIERRRDGFPLQSEPHGHVVLPARTTECAERDVAPLEGIRFRKRDSRHAVAGTLRRGALT